MTDIDYVNYEEGKYPEPEDRCIASDFPKAEELYTYGVDFPMPKSLDDLRSNYNIDERNPLVLADLEGYRVPPMGLCTVGRNGNGFQPKRDKSGGGFIYPPGTFREDKHGIGKELGPSHVEMTRAREENRKQAYTTGIMRKLEEEGLATLDNLKEKDPQAIEALAYMALDLIIRSESAREARLFLEGYYDKMQEKDDALRNIQERAAANKLGSQAMEVIDKLIDQVEIEKQKRLAVESITIVEGDWAE